VTAHGAWLLEREVPKPNTMTHDEKTAAPRLITFCRGASRHLARVKGGELQRRVG
jgi:hypothetical protein